MKILVSAFTCRPGHGSEPGAGWAWAQAAASRHETWVITHPNHRAAIVAGLANEPGSAPLHIVDAELPTALRWVLRPLGRPGWFLYSIAWQVWACRPTALALHQVVGFDVAHHVTYAADWLPSGVSRLPGVPFVWGPVGGSSTTGGLRLWRALGVRPMLTEAARAVLLGLARATVGRLTAQAASVVLAQNEDVRRAFAAHEPVVLPHVAVEHSLTLLPQRPPRPADRAPTAVFAGRLVAWKGLRFAFGALRRPSAIAWHLDIYGDGPERRRMERLARYWDLDHRVRFLGARPRGEVLAAMRDADVVVFPSIHDAAGWTVAEALAVGCPVVAFELGGPATLVGEGDGVLIDPRAPDLEGALASALDRARHLRPGPSRWSRARLPGVLRDIYHFGRRDTARYLA